MPDPGWVTPRADPRQAPSSEAAFASGLPYEPDEVLRVPEGGASLPDNISPYVYPGFEPVAVVIKRWGNLLSFQGSTWRFDADDLNDYGFYQDHVLFPDGWIPSGMPPGDRPLSTVRGGCVIHDPIGNFKSFDRTVLFQLQQNGLALQTENLVSADFEPGGFLTFFIQFGEFLVLPAGATVRSRVPPVLSPRPGAVHPRAAAQATAAGKALNVLLVHDGHIYAGYGDFDANTGPIEVMSVGTGNPTESWVPHVLTDTEQVGSFTELADGRILVPSLDPKGAGGGYAERGTNGSWVDRPTRIAASAEHVFDIVEFAGRLFACGSNANHARVWESTNGGATWAETLASVGTGGNVKFFGLWASGDYLYVEDPQNTEGYRWSQAGGWEPYATDVLLSTLGAPGLRWRNGTVRLSYLRIGDQLASPYLTLQFVEGGAASTIPIGSLRGYTVAEDGSLYVLTEDLIRRAPATGPISFETVARVTLAEGDPTTWCSLAVLPGRTRAVIGTTDSRLLLVDPLDV